MSAYKYLTCKLTPPESLAGIEFISRGQGITSDGYPQLSFKSAGL